MPIFVLVGAFVVGIAGWVATAAGGFVAYHYVVIHGIMTNAALHHFFGW